MAPLEPASPCAPRWGRTLFPSMLPSKHALAMDASWQQWQFEQWQTLKHHLAERVAAAPAANHPESAATMLSALQHMCTPSDSTSEHALAAGIAADIGSVIATLMLHTSIPLGSLAAVHVPAMCADARKQLAAALETGPVVFDAGLQAGDAGPSGSQRSAAAMPAGTPAAAVHVISQCLCLCDSVAEPARIRAAWKSWQQRATAASEAVLAREPGVPTLMPGTTPASMLHWLQDVPEQAVHLRHGMWLASRLCAAGQASWLTHSAVLHCGAALAALNPDVANVGHISQLAGSGTQPAASPAAPSVQLCIAVLQVAACVWWPSALRRSSAEQHAPSHIWVHAHGSGWRLAAAGALAPPLRLMELAMSGVVDGLDEVGHCRKFADVLAGTVCVAVAMYCMKADASGELLAAAALQEGAGTKRDRERASKSPQHAITAILRAVPAVMKSAVAALVAAFCAALVSTARHAPISIAHQHKRCVMHLHSAVKTAAYDSNAISACARAEATLVAQCAERSEWEQLARQRQAARPRQMATPAVGAGRPSDLTSWLTVRDQGEAAAAQAGVPMQPSATALRSVTEAYTEAWAVGTQAMHQEWTAWCGVLAGASAANSRALDFDARPDDDSSSSSSDSAVFVIDGGSRAMSHASRT